MTSGDKISIIIPVHNNDTTLIKCLDSVVSQTYPNLQIIVVDDGSSDNSPTIAHGYIKKYHNIELYSQPNSGVSAARNLGLQHVDGEYISFIDADDTVAPDFIQKLHSAIVENRADVATCGYTCVYPKKSQAFMSDREIVTGPDNFLLSLIGKSKGFCWNKIYERSVLRNLQFNSHVTACEDLDFNVRAARNIKQTAVIPEALYNYFQSSTQSKRSLEELIAFNHIIHYIEKHHPSVLSEYSYAFLIYCYRNKYNHGAIDSPKQYHRLLTTLSSYLKEHIDFHRLPLAQRINLSIYEFRIPYKIAQKVKQALNK